MSLTVKAYLYRNVARVSNGKDPEIRRFGVEEGIATNYDYLERKLGTIFPNLVGQFLRLYWRDADDDFVSFSSDDELLDAISTINDGVFKVYITSQDGTSQDRTDSGENAEPLHPGVTCDGCQSEVRGSRYKCVECPDYDLCRSCEQAGTHPEHILIRLVKPIPCGPNSLRFMFGPGPFGRGGHFPFGPGRGGHFSFGPGHGRHHHRRQNGCHPRAGGQGYPSTEDQSSAETGEHQQETNSADEYLRNIGKSVAAFLDPFGIDVQVDVENNDGQRQRCGQASEATSMDTDTDDKNGKACTPAETNAAASTPETVTVTEQVVAPTTEKNSTSFGPQNSTTHCGMTSAMPPATDTRDQGSWAMYPSIPNPQSRYEPVRQVQDLYERGLAPHIIVALQQMKSMGFSNDGGWLSALLATKNGDIDSTLESLKPNITGNTPSPPSDDRMG